MILNEVLSPVTLAPLRVQIDGKAFEDQVTETPKRGTVEVWKIVNTTGSSSGKVVIASVIPARKPSCHAAAE